MSTPVLILLALAAAVLLFAVFALLAARFRPSLLVPFINLVRRSSWVRTRMDKAALQAVAKNPEVIKEEGIGRAERDALQSIMQGRSEEERIEVLQKAQNLAESGQMQEAAELLRQKPKSASEMEQARKRKEAARKKRKAAKKAKKRSRR